MNSPELSETAAQEIPRTRGTYGYYRQPNGWITVSPSTSAEELKYRREGWEPLLQYGMFEMSTEYAADHPLEPLFMAGGARELSVEQVIQEGLYFNRPQVPTCGQPLNQYHRRHRPGCWAGAKAVDFPQLKGVNIEGPFLCELCQSDGSENAEKATRQVLDQHTRVMHNEEASDVRTGEAIGLAISKALAELVRPTPSDRSKDKILETLMAAGLTKEQQDLLKALALEPPHA